MTYAYRTEPYIDRDGTPRVIVWRRQILSESRKDIELGEVERAVITPGEKPVFQKTGGLLGRPCRITRERYKSCGYTTQPPKEIQQ
ncbi:MAG: hypothetical protein V2I48_15730 [Xanthomonadales bacterium]|jgi:hypothetical protein|nr:hypothetical protein [Xanthomonadales bacterium]